MGDSLVGVGAYGVDPYDKVHIFRVLAGSLFSGKKQVGRRPPLEFLKEEKQFSSS